MGSDCNVLVGEGNHAESVWLKIFENIKKSLSDRNHLIRRTSFKQHIPNRLERGIKLRNSGWFDKNIMKENRLMISKTFCYHGN